MANKTPSTYSSAKDIEQFIEKMNQTPVITDHSKVGRVIIALDATASRQLTWDRACHLQSEMFQAASSIGQLQLQLCYFKGFKQFYTSPWCIDSEQLLSIMNQVRCEAGHTQIKKVLQYALTATQKDKVDAVIYIGDSMEESLDQLCHLAGNLGLLSTPLYIFQEGNDLVAKRAMKEMARLSGGAYHSFNSSSAELLKHLLVAVVVYVTGGKKALQHYARQQGQSLVKLLQQID